MDLIKLLTSLPPQVEYDNYLFYFEIIHDHKNGIKICYKLLPYKTDTNFWDVTIAKKGNKSFRWDNPFYPAISNYLLIGSSVENEPDLKKEISNIKMFFIENGIKT